MRVIAPYFEILESLDHQSLAVRIEACGRICYKSEDKITPASAKEETGALPEMLDHTSGFFDEEIEFSLGRLVTMFEPIILVVMGVIVAGLLLSVYYPLLTIVNRIA